MPSHYTSVVVHEFAHVASDRAGLSGGSWLREGLAEYVESLELTPEGLVDVGPSEDVLMAVAALPISDLGLERLFDWREDGAAIKDGREQADLTGRLLSGLYVRWQVGAQAGAPITGLGARLAVLAARPRFERLAEEPLWQAWLAGQVAAVAVATPALSP